jgi:hypothetical protein
MSLKQQEILIRYSGKSEGDHEMGIALGPVRFSKFIFHLEIFEVR